jgi:hypothetical protein
VTIHFTFTTFRARHVHEQPIRATCILHRAAYIGVFHTSQLRHACKAKRRTFSTLANPARLRFLGIRLLDISGVCKNSRWPYRYPTWPGDLKALLDFSTASPIARWHDRWDGLLCINILIVLVCLQIGAVDSYYGWIGGGIDTLRWNGARGSIKHVYHFLVVLHKHPYPLHPHL